MAPLFSPGLTLITLLRLLSGRYLYYKHVSPVRASRERLMKQHLQRRKPGPKTRDGLSLIWRTERLCARGLLCELC